MCRSLSGRVDEHLRETALNNARYFSIFHNAADAERLARLIFPVTGRVVAGYNWHLGSFEYLPVPAEINEHERRFLSLGPRQVVLWDKLGGDDAQVWRTPEVIMDPPDYGVLRTFETAHLRRTGTPKAELLAEITARQERVRRLFGAADRPTARAVPHMQFGRPL
jgi:hypothetical protein